MGRIVVAVYRPLEGKFNELLRLVNNHYAILDAEGLVSPRRPMIMKSDDNCVIEVFEWNSTNALEEAHQNPQVNKLWEQFSEVCTYEAPVNLNEFNNLFSEFEHLN